ncbi:hypothetical protein F5Y16DRAFT_104432 [Xylariaceae sp. FL0255]|nr:hypothetical protein F5Y16DRAFT_104432 [Xylariaceae sp. FL0255]
MEVGQALDFMIVLLGELGEMFGDVPMKHWGTFRGSLSIWPIPAQRVGSGQCGPCALQEVGQIELEVHFSLFISHHLNMSGMNHECTCGAFFLTREKLDQHVEDQLCQAEYHFSQLEKCRTHSRVPDDEDENHNYTADAPTPEITFGKPCPVRGCSRKGNPFSTQQKLRRHFRIHVRFKGEDKEVCTFCFKVFDLPSQFMSHWESNHKNEDQYGKKTVYMRTAYDELENRVQEELAKEQSRGESRKRAWAGVAAQTQEAQRVKLVNLGTANTGNSLIVDSTSLLQATPDLDQGGIVALSTDSTMAFAPVAHGTTVSTLDDFASIPTQPIYLNPTPGSRSIDAPLLRLFSSSPYFTDLSQNTIWEAYETGHGSSIP